MTTSTPPRKQTHPFKEPARTDPYRSESKPKGTPACPICKAVCFKGRWLSDKEIKTREPRILVTGKHKCPACRQLEDKFALGVVELHGQSWKDKIEQINSTVRRSEEIARSRNDQERILWIEDQDEVKTVYVSLPELARHIGRELERSFHGVAEYQGSPEEPFLRVRWWSDLPHTKHQRGAPFHRKKGSGSP